MRRNEMSTKKNVFKSGIIICTVLMLIFSFIGVQGVHAASKPGKAVIADLSAGTPGKLIVEMKRSSRASGYQIMYSKKSSFASSKTKYTTATTTSVANLKHGSKYYVKARAYSKSGSKKIYDAWSSVKTAYTQGSKGNPMTGYDTFKVRDLESIYTAKIDNIYVDDEALDFLQSIGEDPEEFERDEFDGSIYRPIVIAVNIKAIKGTFYGSDYGGLLYKANKKSKMKLICHMLYENADKDMYGGDAKLKQGKKDTFYCVLGIPEEYDIMYEHFTTVYESFWVKYDLN